MHEVVIGCDNAAVDMKNVVIEYLKEAGIPVENVGVDSAEDNTYYPVIAERVAKKIIESGYKKRGILICGTGIGMAMSANKFPGIRAAVCHDVYSAERSILSNDGNVLCMGARIIGNETAKAMVKTWMNLEFQDGRSTPKVQEIRRIEKETMRAC